MPRPFPKGPHPRKRVLRHAWDALTASLRLVLPGRRSAALHRRGFESGTEATQVASSLGKKGKRPALAGPFLQRIGRNQNFRLAKISQTHYIVEQHFKLDNVGERAPVIGLPYVIFYVVNVTSLLGFYKQAFDLSPSYVHQSGHFAELIAGNVTLAFRSETMAKMSLPQPFQTNGLNSPLQAFEISFHANDVDAVYQQALLAGAIDIAPPHVTPWGQYAANVRDPAGIVIEITEYPK